MAITKIAQVDVGAGGAASISFTGIASTFTDLMVVLSARTDNAQDFMVTYLRPNGDASFGNYSGKALYANGSTVSTGSTNGTFMYANGTTTTASTFTNSSFYLPNYTAATNKNISMDAVGENNATSSAQHLTATTWLNTAAITSITLAPGAGSFVQYSSASLYGISKSGATGATVA